MSSPDRARIVAIAGAGILIAGYAYVERVLPLVRATDAAQREIAAVREVAADRARGRRPAPEARVEVLEELLAKHRATIARLDAPSSRDEASALASLSQLAARCGVVIRESAPVVATADPLAARPRRRLTVVTRFAGLRAFTSGLSTLPGGPIHLERLAVASVEVPVPDSPPEQEAPRVLVVTMVLVP